jgi:hypothetical protein
MRKIFMPLIATAMLLAGCDDGDMTFKTFSFTNPISACATNEDILYSLNGTEALILNIDRSLLENVESARDEKNDYIPQEIILGSSTTLTYRNYSDTATADVICNSGVSAPAIIDEWTSVGTLAVITTPFRDAKTGALLGYDHQITIKNATLRKGDEEITIIDNLYGSVRDLLGFNFKFTRTNGDPISPDRCEDGTVYVISTTEALQLSFGTTKDYLKDSETSTTETNIDLSLDDDDEVYFRVFAGTISDNYICVSASNPQPVSPAESQRWTAVSGTVKIVSSPYTEVSTGELGTQHEIRFYNVVFNKTNPASSQVYSPEATGEDTAGNKYYLFGTYYTGL